jgi:hypothetical protein
MIDYFERIDDSPIFKFKLSEEVYNRISNDVHASINENVDVSDTLVGAIYNGCEVKLNTDYNFLKNLGYEFLKKTSDSHDEIKLYVSEVWTVLQKEYDYNPLHVHSSFLSGILYITVPDFIGLPKNQRPSSCKKNEDGYLVFLNGYGFKTIKPVQGEGYIFPSNMPHMVYPFNEIGNRVSVAWNIDAILNKEINYR